MFGMVKRRRLRGTLSRARRYFHEDMAALTNGTAFAEPELHTFARIFRQFNVLAAARTPWIAIVGVAGTAVTMLAGPLVLVGALTRPQLSSVALALALTTYLTAFGAMMWWHFSRQRYFPWRVQFTRLSQLGTAVSLSAALSLFAVERLLGPIALGLAAGVVATVVRLVVRRLVYALRGPVFAFQIRRCGMMPPAHLVTVMLGALLMNLNSGQYIWRRVNARRELLAQIDWTIAMVGRYLPQMVWWAGIRGEALAPSLRRFREAAAAMRETRTQLIDAGGQEAFTQIRNHVAGAMIAVAGGDWSLLGSTAVPGAKSRLLALTRRLVTPFALIGAAIALPYLPGVTHSGALTTVQIGLIATALLSLTTVESTAQARIVDVLDPARLR
jgi:hypothetical protein